MRGKLLFAVGLATGYVLGTRAGRRRYEQIKSGAEKVWNLPPIQAGVHGVQDFANARVDVVQQKLTEAVKNAIAQLLSPGDSSRVGESTRTGESSPSGAQSTPGDQKLSAPVKAPVKPRTKSTAAAEELATDGNSDH